MKMTLKDYTAEEIEALTGGALQWAVVLAMGATVKDEGNLGHACYLFNPGGWASMRWWPGEDEPSEEDDDVADPLALLQEMQAADLWPAVRTGGPGEQWEADIVINDECGFSLRAPDPATAVKRAYCTWKLREANAK